METFAIYDAIGATLIAIVVVAAIMAMIDMIICMKKAPTVNKKHTFGILTYLCTVISIFVVFGYGTFAVYRYDNDLCSFNVNDKCMGKCTPANCKRSCSSVSCIKYGKECSKSCNLLNVSMYLTFAWGSVGFFGVCCLFFCLGSSECRYNQYGICEQCRTKPTNDNYKTEMGVQIQINDTKKRMLTSEFEVLNVLKSKIGIPQIFIQNIQTILVTPFPQSIDIANSFINAYFSDIVRHYNLTHIIPMNI
eukprot:521627_1